MICLYSLDKTTTITFVVVLLCLQWTCPLLCLCCLSGWNKTTFWPTCVCVCEILELVLGRGFNCKKIFFVIQKIFVYSFVNGKTINKTYVSPSVRPSICRIYIPMRSHTQQKCGAGLHSCHGSEKKNWNRDLFAVLECSQKVVNQLQGEKICIISNRDVDWTRV